MMNTKTLLKSLNENDVKYVVIGAMAGVAHGYVRTTQDIDIFVEPSRENIEKAIKALTRCGYDMADVSVEDAMNYKILLRGYILKTDIHPFVKGVEWKAVWENRVSFMMEGERVNFASLEDLIEMKKAAGRSQDLEDLRHLEEIRRQLLGSRDK